MRAVCCLSLALTLGCGPKRTTDTGPELAGWEVQRGDPPMPAKAVHPRRVIAVTTDGVCPEPEVAAGAWSVARLVVPAEEGPSDASEDAEPAPTLVERFCVYTADSEVPPPFVALGSVPSVTVAEVSPGVVAAYDRAALLPAMTQATDVPVPTLVARTGAMGGALASGLDAPEGGAGRVVILHAGPDAGATDAGERLAAIGRALACPEPDCPVIVEAQDLRVDGVGTVAGLADALVAVVSDWEARVAEAGDEGGLPAPPVVAVTAGWHAVYGGAHPRARDVVEQGELWFDDADAKHVFSWRDVEPDYFEPDVRAVFDALAWARCAGVLVVAPEGLATAGPTGRLGPALPGAWQGLTPDLLPTCDRFGSSALPPASAPLVWTVGDIGTDGGLLGTSRERTRAPLLAYGDHLAHDGDDVALVGSGAAAAVVAVTAGLLCSQAPTLESQDVMTRVYASGRPLDEVVGPLRASLVWWLPDGALPEAAGLPALDVPHAKRKAEPSTVWVRACDVLSRIVGGRVTCATVGARELPALPEAPGLGVGSYLTGPDTHPRCGGDVLRPVALADAEPSDVPCPDRQFHSRDLSGRAVAEPCAGCRLDALSGVLQAQHPGLARADALAVRVWDDAGVQTVYVVPRTALQGDRLEWGLPPEELPTGARAAALAVTAEGTTTVWPLLFRPRGR
jgi:hypothetical protein